MKKIFPPVSVMCKKSCDMLFGVAKSDRKHRTLFLVFLVSLLFVNLYLAAAPADADYEMNWGNNTLAIGLYGSTAWGSNTTASGDYYATAWGSRTVAGGNYSTAGVRTPRQPEVTLRPMGLKR